MDWHWKSFGELTKEQLYDALRLRQEVFVVEQQCPYLDTDGLDADAMHLLAYYGDGPVAYARVLPPGARYAEPCISRVATAGRVRGTGLGRELMAECIRRLEGHHGKVPVRISAQAYLRGFYGSFGFRPTGKEYLEDGIPHLEMLRP